MMSDEEKILEEKALRYIIDHKKDLIKKFADTEIYPPVKNPFSFFMAGSPGAGKTEITKELIKILSQLNPSQPIVRIDADLIREFIPLYNGKNSNVVQKSASRGVDKLYDYSLHKKQNVVVDGTFANYNQALENIKRSLKHKRGINIIYIYLDPISAWEFTKKREVLEGRYVPADIFVDAVFAAKDNVNKIKSIFKERIILDIIIKNSLHQATKIEFGIDDIDKYLQIPYTKETLKNQLCL